MFIEDPDLGTLGHTGTPSQFLISQLLRPILEKHSLFRLSKVKCRNCIHSKVLQIFGNFSKKMGKFNQTLVVRQFLRATLEKHSLFALSKEDFWNRDPCSDFLRKIYLRNWLGVPVADFQVSSFVRALCSSIIVPVLLLVARSLKLQESRKTENRGLLFITGLASIKKMDNKSITTVCWLKDCFYFCFWF